MPDYWQHVGGWFGFEDVYSQAISEAQDGDTLIEVGVWLGRSLCFLGEKARDSGKKLTVFGVDCFTSETWGSQQMQEEAARHGGDMYGACLRNLAASGLLGCVHLLAKPSVQAAGLFAPASVFMVFIDTDHSYASCLQDTAAWLPRIKPGGIFAGHDYSRPGMKQGLDESLPGHERTGHDCWFYRVSLSAPSGVPLQAGA